MGRKSGDTDTSTFLPATTLRQLVNEALTSPPTKPIKHHRWSSRLHVACCNFKAWFGFFWLGRELRHAFLPFLLDQLLQCPKTIPLFVLQ